ncbi:MAG: amidase [Acidobacteria bacterium 13_1_40CM_65_14]|nr:MAG: amidase [Acidobacteria bacterium 13_1_40CM_65_14]
MAAQEAAVNVCFASARELARLIRARKASVREVMAAHLLQINRLNPALNAIVAKLDDDQCFALADEADRRLASGEDVGPLHGLPIAFKDLEAAVGFPFTRGSPIFANEMPAEDTLLVERLRQAGVIPIGKTNVPELGMGSHTYNKVYGTTLNPYDQTKSAGGSSGGAAAAVATGMLPCADGSDLGGSLRNPGSFNNVVGFRPTFGLVPVAPTPLPCVGFGVKGPIARSVEDAAFLLSTIAGSDPRDPSSYPSDPSAFAQLLERDFKNVRVAWCPDLGGLPLDPRVRGVLERQRKTFEDLGCIVEQACPELAAADKIFLDIRLWMSSYNHAPLLEQHRDQLKPEAVWEIETGLGLSARDVAAAIAQHGELLQRMRRFQDDYEFILCTVNQLPPFDASTAWPKEIDGVRMEHYVAWMKSTYWISATLCPALSVPAGFTDDGLPVGIQIVGRRRDDLGVLQLGHAFEQATGFGQQRPPVV